MSFFFRSLFAFAFAILSIPWAQAATINRVCQNIDTSAAILVLLSPQWSDAALEFCSAFIHIPAVTKTVATSYSVTTITTTTPTVVISTNTLPTTISTLVIPTAGSTEIDFTAVSTIVFSTIASTETDYATPFSTTISTTVETDTETTTISTNTTSTTVSTETDTTTAASTTFPFTVSTETDAITVNTQTLRSVITTETDITDVATRTARTTYSTQVPYTTSTILRAATSTLPAMRKRDAEVQERAAPTPTIPAFLKLWASSVLSNACSCVATLIPQTTIPVTASIVSSIVATSPTSIVSNVYSSIISTTYSSFTETDISSITASETTSLTSTEISSLTASETTSVTLTETSSFIALQTTSITATDISSVIDTEYSSVTITTYSSVSATTYSSATLTLLSSLTSTITSSVIFTSPTQMTKITQTSFTTIPCPSPTVPNGDFETDQLNPFGFSWVTSASTAPGTDAVVPNTLGTPANGNYYLQVITPAYNASRGDLVGGIQLPPTCLNGKNYTFNVDYLFNSTEPYLEFVFGVLNNAFSVTTVIVSGNVAANQWLTATTPQFTFNTSNAEPVLEIELDVFSSQATYQAVMILFDNLRFTPV